MSSLDTTYINTPGRGHRRLLKQLSTGQYELAIDNTTLEKMVCPRMLEHYAVYGRDTAKRDALNYGSAMHHALELFYKSEDQADPAVLLQMQDRIMQHFSRHPCSADDWRHADHALEACRRYFNWRQQCPPWIPLVRDGVKQVEIPFKHHLMTWVPGDDNEGYCEYPASLVTDRPPTGYPDVVGYVESVEVYWTGVIDLVIERNGKPCPIDHKTTSVEGAQFYDSFRLSSQLMGYTWGTQKTLGEPVDGAIVDALIGRPPTRTGIAYENKYFPVDFDSDQLFEWHRDTCNHVSTLLSRLVDGYFPKQTTWCVNKFGKCPYHDVCTMTHQSQPLILMSGQFAERTWDPLVRERFPDVQPLPNLI